MLDRLLGFCIPSNPFIRPSRSGRAGRIALSTVLLGLGLAAAQTVQLQGTLQDRYTGQPIEDAEVALVVQGLKTRTDAAGRFEIRRVPTRLGGEGSGLAVIRRFGAGLSFTIPEPAMVTVRLHDAQGRLPMRTSRARLEAGEWTYHPGGLPLGLYFLVLETPASRAAIRLPVLEAFPAGPPAPGFARDGAATSPVQKRSSGAALDTLRFSKAGYISGIEPILSLNQSGMIATIKDSGSTQSALAAFSLANTPLQPPFQAGTLAYRASVRESVQTLAYSLSTGKAKPTLIIMGNGEVLASPTTPAPLNIGRNTFEIRSTSQDGSSSVTYAFQIHRARDTASSLRNLRINEQAGILVPAFASPIRTYKMEIAANATSASLFASWDEPLAAVRINGTLQTGEQVENIIGFPGDQDSIRTMVEVRSPDGLHTSTYTIDFLREQPPPPPPPATAGLASVTASLNATLVPAWSPDVTQYRLEVHDTASILQLTFTPTRPEAYVKAGSLEWQQGTVVESLPFKGSPQISLHPVAVRNGTDTARYTFTMVSTLSKDASLSAITVSPAGAGPAFNPGTMQDWTLIFGIGDSVVNLRPLPTSRFAKVALDGATVPYGTIVPLALKPGNNRFVLTVTSQEGSLTRTHNLYFGRLKPKGPVMPPTLTGPSRGYTYYPYAYAFKPSSDTCLQGMNFISRIYYGDGAWQQQGGTAPPSQQPFGTHAWSVPGTFTVKAVCHCSNGYLTLPGDTSAPITVQIEDPSNGGRVRTLSGPRSASETWSPDTVYRVVGNTLFETGTTLTILPGTTVLFPYPGPGTGYYLAVHGGFSAVGAASDSIRFEGPGALRIRWQGPLSYNPDGSYRAGPRFEYVTFQGGSSLYLDETGGYGFYMKHSHVPLITAEFTRYARGSYIEKCRIGDLSSVILDNSRILNSYFTVLSLNAGASTSLTLNRCDIRTLKLGTYSADTALTRISGNTIGTVQGGWYASRMYGNNILGTTTGTRTLCYSAQGTAAVNLQDNYWGEVGTAEMVAKGPNQNLGVITDYLDNVEVGKADYSAWRTAPVPEAAPDW